MSSILNEIFQNFEELANKQKELEKSEFDTAQFDLIDVEAGINTEEPTRYLQNSLLVNAEDSTDLLSEKKFPFGQDRKDIIEEAHPETVSVADGPHTSGVVDNQNQQQQKIINMINKMPTGNVFHDLRLAEQVKELVSVAESLDEDGFTAEALAIDEIAFELASLKKKVD